MLLNILSGAAKSSGVQVIIGQENTYAPMQTCSIVTCTYYVGDDVVGTLGSWGRPAWTTPRWWQPLT